ncbi:Uncharacterised protein [Mycobacterium tuberculosis]|nr:Uncharacterised protein [Mycobacterium tuberculosis]CKR17753.1 Uncharacterised protein [Mycobacterium tuberculosis]
MPRTLPLSRVRRVFLVEGQLVGYPAGGDQLAAVLHQRRQRPATLGVDGQPIVLVGDVGAGYQFPAWRLVGGHQPVNPPAQRGHVARQPGDRPSVVLDERGHLSPVGIEHPHAGLQRRVDPGSDDVGAPLGQRVPHDDAIVRRGDRAGQQPQRVVPGRAAQLPRVTPPGQQVEVDLVGLRAGDGVVVRTVGQLHPRLGQRRLRILGAGQQRGEHREPLGFQDGVLGGPVGLFGVDVGDVLAGVDRVHVAGLRQRHPTTLGQFGAHRGEELLGQRAHEARPGVARTPVAVDGGDPLVRRGVVGAHRQEHVAGQRDLFELVEQRVGGGLSVGQRGGRVHRPARRIMRRHVMGQQAATRRRDPLELAAKLHAVYPALGRTPLVVWPAGPGTRRQPGIGGQPRKLRVMAEHVELPRGGRLGAQHVTLKTDAVHQVSDGGLRAGEVGVGFVVGSAHHFDTAIGEEPAQVGAVLRVGIPVRLEVVHLG